MSKQKPQYLVSTDSIGLLGKPEQFIYLWKEYFENYTLDGVEIAAFKSLRKLNNLISTLGKNNIPTLSFHGKTGGENQLDFIRQIIMTLVNSRILDVKTLLKNFSEKDFLSHSPYFEEESIKKIVFEYKPKKIWIENHLHSKKGVEDAIRQIGIYRENKINANGMLDIYHYVADSDLLANWSDLVGELKQYFLLKDKDGQRFFSGIHFPIGTRLDDSLPIDSMKNQMLELFAQEIIPYSERVVFENQQNFPGLLFSTDKMLRKQKVRNEKIIDRFKKTGIIKS